MSPLTDDEAALLYTVTMNGSRSYPVRKLGNRWSIGPWRGWTGFPLIYKTRKAAVAQFEKWIDSANMRFAEMKEKNPRLILTAVGIR